MWLVNITHRVLVLLFVSPMVHELVGAGGLVGAARGAKNTPLIQEEPARKRGPISTGLFPVSLAFPSFLAPQLFWNLSEHLSVGVERAF
jgi:hypothetical protein